MGQGQKGDLGIIKRIDTLSEKIMCTCIESEFIPPSTQIQSPSIFREQGNHFLDVMFKDCKIGDSLFAELGTEKGTGIGPCFAVDGEDAVSKELQYDEKVMRRGM